MLSRGGVPNEQINQSGSSSKGCGKGTGAEVHRDQAYNSGLGSGRDRMVLRSRQSYRNSVFDLLLIRKNKNDPRELGLPGIVFMENVEFSGLTMRLFLEKTSILCKTYNFFHNPLVKHTKCTKTT